MAEAAVDINPQVKKLTWKIENFFSIEGKRLYSNSFTVGGIRWRLLIFPKGNNVDDLSIYVGVADSATLAHGWSIYAQFRLTVVDQINRESSITSEVATHEFNAKDVYRGSKSFLSLSELHNPKRGYLVNNTCLVEVDIGTDKTIDLKSLDLIVESKDVDYVKAAIDNQKALVIKAEEITTPSPAVNAALAILSFLQQDKGKSTNQNLPSAQSSAQCETTESEDPTEEDTFFTSLESELALAKIEEALNMAPANFHDSGEFSSLHQAFKILSSFDFSSTLTIEQKNKLLAMEEKFKELLERVAKAMQDRNLLTEKESVKLTLTHNLKSSLIKFKEAKAEVKQIEQKIVALHEQVNEAQKKRENILAEWKHIFRSSHELKMELEALERQWPDYEARAKVAEEEEKTVEAEWGRMKDFISSIKGKIKGKRIN